MDTPIYSVSLHDQPAALVCEHLTQIAPGIAWAVRFTDALNDTLLIKLSFLEEINGRETMVSWSREFVIDVFMFETKYVLDGSEFSFDQLERDSIGEDVEDCDQFARRLGLTRHGREFFDVVARGAADDIVTAICP